MIEAALFMLAFGVALAPFALALIVAPKLAAHATRPLIEPCPRRAVWQHTAVQEGRFPDGSVIKAKPVRGSSKRKRRRK